MLPHTIGPERVPSILCTAWFTTPCAARRTPDCVFRAPSCAQLLPIPLELTHRRFKPGQAVLSSRSLTCQCLKDYACLVSRLPAVPNTNRESTKTWPEQPLSRAVALVPQMPVAVCAFTEQIDLCQGVQGASKALDPERQRAEASTRQAAATHLVPVTLLGLSTACEQTDALGCLHYRAQQISKRRAQANRQCWQANSKQEANARAS